jgi:hypothetical protein
MLSPDVENVLSIQKKRSEREEQLKQKMLQSVKEKINNYAKLGQTNFIYTVPNFLIGEIPYSIDKMSKYICRKLKDEGFYIIKISTQFIYISWDIKDIAKSQSSSSRKGNSSTSDLNNFSAFVNSNKKTF